MFTRVLVLFDRFYCLWLALAAPFLLFPSAKWSPVMLVVPALFLLRWWVTKRKQPVSPGETLTSSQPPPSALPSTPLDSLLLLMTFMVLVSLWVTNDINYSLPKISGMVLGLGVFYSLVRAGQTPRGWWLSFVLFLVIGVCFAVIGLLGTHWATKVTLLAPILSRLTPRLTGLPGAGDGFNPNTVAGALLWVVPSFLAFSWFLLIAWKDKRALFGHGKPRIIPVLVIGAMLWTMAVFFLTQSREAYIALALTLPLLILLFLPRKWRKVSLAVLSFLAIIGLVLITLRWRSVQSLVFGAGLSADPAFSLDSFNGRLEVWSRAIYAIQDFPITGMGMNNFRKLLPVLYPVNNMSAGFDIGHAHNEFLQAALDLGIPGLIAFIGLYIAAFWMLIRTWKINWVKLKSESGAERTSDTSGRSGRWFSAMNSSPFADTLLTKIVIMGLGGGLLAHLLWGMTDAMALGARPALLFWITLGLIAGLHQQAQNVPQQ